MFYEKIYINLELTKGTVKIRKIEWFQRKVENYVYLRMNNEKDFDSYYDNDNKTLETNENELSVELTKTTSFVGRTFSKCMCMCRKRREGLMGSLIYQYIYLDIRIKERKWLIWECQPFSISGGQGLSFGTLNIVHICRYKYYQYRSRS